MIGQYPSSYPTLPPAGLVYPNGEVSTLSRQPIMSTVSQPSQYMAGQPMAVQSAVPVMLQYQQQPAGQPGLAQYQPVHHQQTGLQQGVSAGQMLQAAQSMTSSYHESVTGQSVLETDQV